MNRSRVCVRTSVLAASLWMALPHAGAARAQGTNPNFQVGKEEQQERARQAEQQQLAQGAAKDQSPKLDPKEEAAYKAFYDTPSSDPDKRIQLGKDFIAAYPSSRYAESVYVGLVHACYAKQDWQDFYASAERALALKPDEIGVLTMVGWVTPHVLVGNEPDAGERLDQAEAYEKKAMVAIASLSKPDAMTDDQFALYKAEMFNQAHSGLGLIYFRRQQYEDSVKELQQATQGAAKPDPTDVYALAASLFNLKRYSEASEVFSRCAQIPSNLQDNCKQQADKAHTLATQLR